VPQPGEDEAWVEASVSTGDDYVVLGGLPFGTPITIRAQLTASVSGSGAGMIQEGTTNSASGVGPLEIVINSTVGAPIRILCELGLFAQGNWLFQGIATGNAGLTFLDLPPGTTITSCQGYVQTTLVTAVGDGSGRPEFHLESVGPNPANGTFALAATLPTDVPATLALYDVHGRLIASTNLGGLGAGRHIVQLGSDKQLSAGVYYARLTQSGRSVQRKQVVLR
jgi:hypothetical protein